MRRCATITHESVTSPKTFQLTMHAAKSAASLPSLLFGGNPVPELSTIKLLGVTFDPKLSFAEHIRAVSIRGKQRLGLLRRAAPYLSREGHLTMYKGFVRPVWEYAPLVWMGADPSHIARLDNIQRRALRINGPGTELQSLSLQRYVDALTYTYKLHFITGSTQLLAVLPPRLEPRDATRTRNDLRMAAGHSFQLRNPLPRQAPDTILNSFPHCAIQLWNSLPPAFLYSAQLAKIFKSLSATSTNTSADRIGDGPRTFCLLTHLHSSAPSTTPIATNALHTSTSCCLPLLYFYFC